MKKIFGVLTFICLSLLIFSSCEKESDLDGEYDTSATSLNALLPDSILIEYPSTIDDYVGVNYPGASIDEVKVNENGEFEVELNDDLETELLFDADGNFLEVIQDDADGDMDEDDPESDSDEEDDEDKDYDEDEEVTEYPEAIDAYIEANYPGSNIDEIELDDEGNFEVELDDEFETELLFAPDGSFLNVVVDDMDGK